MRPVLVLERTHYDESMLEDNRPVSIKDTTRSEVMVIKLK